MSIINRQKDSHASSITPEQLGKALSKVDLKAIPPHKRKAALADAMATIMSQTIHDSRVRDEIKLSQIMHRKKHGVL